MQPPPPLHDHNFAYMPTIMQLKDKRYSWGSQRLSNNRNGRRSMPDVQKLRQIPPALGASFETIYLRDIKIDEFLVSANITGCRYVASYNLTDDADNKIIVPGEPPKWTPLTHTFDLKKDSGEYYRDENAARFPNHPLEPVVRAVFHVEPAFKPSTIDMVACSNTITSLLRFAQGKAESFTFTVKIIGQTAFLIRRNQSPRELLTDVTGAGHTFLASNTTPPVDLEGTASHQRIVSYKLAGSTLLVRSGVDCYDLEDGIAATPSESAKQVTQKPAFHGAASGLTIVQDGGKVVQQSAVIDVKTRYNAKRSEEIMQEQLPRLWVRQVHKLVLAFHDGHKFPPRSYNDVTAEIQSWETANKSSIARLSSLLDRIKQAAGESKNAQIEVRSAGFSSLTLHELAEEEVGKWNAITADMEDKWIKM